MEEKRSLPSLLHHIFNADSRKVGFGWWLFIVSSALRWHGKVDSLHWLVCVVFAAILVGGGTVVDELIKVGRAFIEAKVGGVPPAPAPAAAAAVTPAPGAAQ